jgi:endogenous inhibitor of DNA gyrase (YacG/DUF329 family)
MAKKRRGAMRCPICRTLVRPGDAEMPFCSERCRTIDLGKWASGAYRISSPVLDPDILEGAEEDTPHPPGGGPDETIQ